jgi:hypothetical protein
MSRRNLSRSLTRHALAVMPPGRRPWALGMMAELDHIEEDGAALAFALGALWAGYAEAARLRSNWLRLGRLGVALGAAVGGAGLFYMSLVLRGLPEAVQPAVPFAALSVLLGFGYIGAGWALARRNRSVFTGLVGGTAVLIGAAAFAFAAGPDAASPFAFYSELMSGKPAGPSNFFAALLLEQAVWILSVAGLGGLFWRLEARRAWA